MFDCTTLRAKYIVLIFIVTVFFLVELIVGIIANSITLQTDAFHMLSDLLALIIGFVALMILNRKHHRYTYGWTRAEIIAGMINSVFLLAIAFILVLENIEKLVELVHNTSNNKLEEHIDLVLIVAGAGLGVNLIGIAMFYNEHSHSHSHSHTGAEDTEEVVVRNYAQAAVLLHIIGDTLGSLLVIASGLAIKYIKDDWRFFLDPLGSLLIVIFISLSSGQLLWQCIKVLMHRWAGHPPMDIKNELTDVAGVKAIHDFHVWSLDNKVSVASMHIQVQSKSVNEIDQILTAVKNILHSHEIHSSTIQPEWGDTCIEPTCQTDCSDKQCCMVDVES